MLVRIGVGLGVAALGGIFAGPAGALAGWKLGGLAATGNPLHLIPGGSLVADGMSATAELADAAGVDLGGLDPGERRRK